MNHFFIIGLMLFASTGKVFSQWVENDTDWMKNIDGNLKLNQINIPGTHDSGTFGIVDPKSIPQYKTQDRSILNQLKSGIRYLDIRLAWDEKDKTTTIMHSEVNCLDEDGKKLTYENVLKACNTFLNDHSYETIVIHLKNENDCYETQFDKDVGEDVPVKVKCTDRIKQVTELISNKDFIFTENRIPVLEEVRGKIVIATRTEDYPGILIKVPDNSEEINYVSTPCEFDNNYECRTQDGYNLEEDKKWLAIENLMNAQGKITQGSAEGENLLSINFMSTTKGVLKDVATRLNNKLIMDNLPDLIDDEDSDDDSFDESLNKRSIKLISGKQYGWVLVDFANEDISRFIYNTNSFKN